MQPTTMKLPLKDTGRIAHHKPNSTTFLQSQDYRSHKKRDFTPPRTDPLAVEKTETNRILKTTYSDTYHSDKYSTQNSGNKSPVRSRDFDVSPNRTPRGQPRFANPSPKINKTPEFSYFKLENVPQGKSEEEFKRDLRKQGINPVSVTLRNDTITHQGNGRAYMVINADEQRTTDIKAKLASTGITMHADAENKRVHHQHNK